MIKEGLSALRAMDNLIFFLGDSLMEVRQECK